MHSPAARALLQPCALLHHPRDTLKDLTLAGHVITITYCAGIIISNPMAKFILPARIDFLRLRQQNLLLSQPFIARLWA